MKIKIVHLKTINWKFWRTFAFAKVQVDHGRKDGLQNCLLKWTTLYVTPSVALVHSCKGSVEITLQHRRCINQGPKVCPIKLRIGVLSSSKISRKDVIIYSSVYSKSPKLEGRLISWSARWRPDGPPDDYPCGTAETATMVPIWGTCTRKLSSRTRLRIFPSLKYDYLGVVCLVSCTYRMNYDYPSVSVW
jgi:hypothetical protein